MSQKNEVCIVRAELVSKGFLGIGGYKYKLVAETKVGDKIVDTNESAVFVYNTPPGFEILNNLVSQLLEDGWQLVGKEKSLNEICHEYEPQRMTFTRARRTDVDVISINPMQALQLLHSDGFVTDEEFLSISKRIKDS